MSDTLKRIDPSWWVFILGLAITSAGYFIKSEDEATAHLLENKISKLRGSIELNTSQIEANTEKYRINSRKLDQVIDMLDETLEYQRKLYAYEQEQGVEYAKIQ